MKNTVCSKSQFSLKKRCEEKIHSPRPPRSVTLHAGPFSHILHPYLVLCFFFSFPFFFCVLPGLELLTSLISQA